MVNAPLLAIQTAVFAAAAWAYSSIDSGKSELPLRAERARSSLVVYVDPKIIQTSEPRICRKIKADVGVSPTL